MHTFTLPLLFLSFLFSIGYTQERSYISINQIEEDEVKRRLWKEQESQCLKDGEIERHFWGKNMNLWKITTTINNTIIPTLEEIEILNRKSLKKNGCFDQCDLLSEIRTEFKGRSSNQKSCSVSLERTYKYQEEVLLEEGQDCDRQRRKQVYLNFKHYIDPFMDPRIKASSFNLDEYRNRCPDDRDCPFKQAFKNSANFYNSCPMSTCDADITTLLKIDPITCRGHLDITLDCTHKTTRTWMIVANVPNYDVDIYYDAKLQCLENI